MGRSVTIEAARIYDTDLIKALITRDDIWATVAEDGQLCSEFEPEVNAQCWLLMTSDDQHIGLYNLHAHNAVTVEIHAHVLPEYRAEHSRSTGASALKWLYDHHPEYQKVVAQIPCIYENVKKFTCSFGFQLEGVNRLSYLKNGEIIDQWLLGMTRDEIGGFLNE